MSPPGIDDAPDGASGGGRPRTLQPLTNDLIGAVLAARDYTVYRDAEGDLLGMWDDSVIHFFQLGNDGEVLQVRTMAGSAFSIDDVPALYAFCNTWNHDRLWPKAFVHVNDDGSARVCGEVIVDLAQGVTLPQLDQLITCGIATGCQMSEAVAGLRA